ncbi:hypothetical protein E6C60_3531 [Paenibacillus algicola]|uniref:Uncharacterized protein n=1 Tax=Paenibacillus algicola TaxID=2565926 RepID=A0A4P8XR42_9BACL|nr:hypothetical protein E6C60_3531 [Paenibacillus algicola]
MDTTSILDPFPDYFGRESRMLFFYGMARKAWDFGRIDEGGMMENVNETAVQSNMKEGRPFWKHCVN